jgi:ArsR family transcriptional regulator, arsenate/arsenite/antimonite-responsive transcriptional repressor
MQNIAYMRDTLNNLVTALKALSDETRIRMLNLLLQRECCVCEVMQVLKISQTRASRNLSILRQAGFLKQRKEGLWAYYSIDKSLLNEDLASLLKGVETGLKDSPVAIRDRKDIKKTRRMGPQYCHKR